MLLFNNFHKFYVEFLLIIFLASCNGTPSITNNITPKLAVDCSGINCGADGMRYTGSGLGVWSYINTGPLPKPLQISLRGLQHNKVTLVFSNLSNQTQNMPKNLNNSNVKPQPPVYIFNTIDPIPTDYTQILPVRPETRVWQVPQIIQDNNLSINFPSTLRGESTIAGFTYKIWVADQEWTPHAQKTIPVLIAMIFGTPGYPGMISQYINDFATQPWGNYPATADNASLISSDMRTINIVIAPNGAGAVQFFDSAQMYQSVDSNQALAVFIGSNLFSCTNMLELLCMDPEKRDLSFAFTNNLLHELTHLIHYYHRAVLPGVKRRFEPWLEEAISSSHGYIVAISRFPHTPASSKEFAAWFSGNYVCSLNSNQGTPGTIINQACSQNYYKSGQAFLVFLVQQYGTGFYRKLLNAKGSGIDALDEAIKSSGGTSFEDSFRRWGSMLALPEAKKLPLGYGYPDAKIGNYLVPALNGSDFAPLRQLSATLPDKIEPYSHLVLVVDDQSGEYGREVDTPPGVAITVYIQ